MKTKSKEKQENVIKLRLRIIESCGIRLHTPKDYELLSSLIFQKTHSNVSSSTLKRFFGYLPGNEASASVTTLDILSRFVGFADFDAFVQTGEIFEQDSFLDKNVATIRSEVHSIKMQLENLLEQLKHVEEKL